MEELEDSLAALVAEFNRQTGRRIELCPSDVQERGYVVFSLRDFFSDQSRVLTLCIFDVVEPWGQVGLPEAAGEIQDALTDFWSEAASERSGTMYIPPKSQHVGDV